MFFFARQQASPALGGGVSVRRGRFTTVDVPGGSTLTVIFGWMTIAEPQGVTSMRAEGCTGSCRTEASRRAMARFATRAVRVAGSARHATIANLTSSFARESMEHRALSRVEKRGVDHDIQPGAQAILRALASRTPEQASVSALQDPSENR